LLPRSATKTFLVVGSTATEDGSERVVAEATPSRLSPSVLSRLDWPSWEAAAFPLLNWVDWAARAGHAVAKVTAAVSEKREREERCMTKMERSSQVHESQWSDPEGHGIR
jgi:hypothetical protein